MQKNDFKLTKMKKQKTMLFTRNIHIQKSMLNCIESKKYEEFVKHLFGAETCLCLLSFIRFKIISRSLL